MAGKIKLQKPKNIGEVTDHAGNILAWAVLLIYFIGLPFYYKDGYTLIASNKYLYLMYTAKYVAIAAGVFLLVRMSLWGYSKDEIACYKATYKTDIFVLSFILLSVLSHFCSSFRSGGEAYLTDWFIEGSLWGTKGWYMGLVSYLVFAMFYLILSKLLRHTYFAYIPVLLTVTLVSIWGILNRYKIAPINMNNSYGEGAFIASLGNINWFCGYTSVIVPLGWGLYMGAKKLWIKVLHHFLYDICQQLGQRYFCFVCNHSGLTRLFVYTKRKAYGFYGAYRFNAHTGFTYRPYGCFIQRKKNGRLGNHRVFLRKAGIYHLTYCFDLLYGVLLQGQGISR